MDIETILEKLLNPLLENGCPCELNIPCPYIDPNNEEVYCENGDCIQGMKTLLTKMIKGE